MRAVITGLTPKGRVGEPRRLSPEPATPSAPAGRSPKKTSEKLQAAGPSRGRGGAPGPQEFSTRGPARPRRARPRPLSFRDTIAIRGLSLDCVVGVYPRERATPQPLKVDAELFVDTEHAAQSERLSHSVDYEAVTRQVTFLLESCRFRLLETAAHVLARCLLAEPAPGERRAQIQALRLRLTKPGALGQAAVPSLEIEREASWVKISHEHKPFGVVDVIHEGREAGIYRLNVAPGRTIPLHVHRRMREAELMLGDGLLCCGQRVPRGTINRWRHDQPHSYANPTQRHQSILCVDAPCFIETDEIRVDETGRELAEG